MFRSKLSSIYIFAVVKSSHLSKYGFNKVLKPFVEDMKQLVIVETLFCLMLLHYLQYRQKELRLLSMNNQ